jgi:hypothetical protein
MRREGELRRAGGGILIGLFLFLAAVDGRAQDRGFGLGVILGEPTGLSGKLWVSGSEAIDAGMAWSFRKPGFLHLHADYLWHFPLHVREVERFSLYAGIGGRLGIRESKPLVGIRIAGGFAYWPKGTPLDIFVEFAPVVDLAPATEFGGNGGIGIRFFFN